MPAWRRGHGSPSSWPGSAPSALYGQRRRSAPGASVPSPGSEGGLPVVSTGWCDKGPAAPGAPFPQGGLVMEATSRLPGSERGRSCVDLPETPPRTASNPRQHSAAFVWLRALGGSGGCG